MLVSIRHPLWSIRQFFVSPLSQMLDRLYPIPYTRHNLTFLHALLDSNLWLLGFQRVCTADRLSRKNLYPTPT